MLESLRSVDEGVKQIVDTLGALHRLRNTYIIFTSDNGFFFGEHRLTGGKFLAYEPSTHLPLPDPGAGDQGRHRDRGAGGQHRHRPDRPRTGRSRSRQKHRRPLARPLHARPEPALAAADPLRVLRRDHRRRSQRRTDRASGRGATTKARPSTRRPRRARLDRRAAQGLPRDPPRPLQVHRVAERRERALRPHQGPERAQQRRPRPQPLHRSAPSSTPSWSASRPAAAAAVRKRRRKCRSPASSSARWTRSGAKKNGAKKRNAKKSGITNAVSRGFV